MSVTRLLRGAVAMAMMAVVTAAYGSFDRPIKVTHEKEQIKYYDTKFQRGVRKVFYNLRDGTLGLVQNAWQLGNGLCAGAGIVTGKALVFAGDVVGFADDNIITRPIFRGIVSDIIEEISYCNFRGVKTCMLVTHELDDIAIVIDRKEYTDDNVVFKKRLYLRPWAVIVLPATVVGDGIIRPAGSLAKALSIRRFTDMAIEDVAGQLDRCGLQMIFKAYNKKLFLPIAGEEEPDLRIYTEEEIVGLKPPGPMLRPTE